MNSNRTRKAMHDHLFLNGARVNSRTHAQQLRAARAGVTDLAGWTKYRLANDISNRY